jgi:ribose transport system permease protein
MNMKQIRTLITLGLVVLVALIFGVSTSSFFTTLNVTNLLHDASYVGTISLGMCVVMISGNIDLSAGGIVCLTGCVCARLANLGLPMPLVVIGTLAVGLLLGWFNSFMVNHLHLTPFVATLAAGFAYTGLGLIFAFRDGQGRIVNQMIKNKGFAALGGKVGIIYYSVIVWLILLAVIYFVQIRTKFGMHVYAMGSNENGAKMSGVRLVRNKAICYMICGALCAVAAIFTVAYNQTATPSLGSSMEFQAIAACVVGGVVMSGGSGNAIGATLGALFMSMLNNGLLKYGIGTDWQNIMLGGIIVVATAFDAVFTKVTNARLRAKNA